MSSKHFTMATYSEQWQLLDHRENLHSYKCNWMWACRMSSSVKIKCLIPRSVVSHTLNPSSEILVLLSIFLLPLLDNISPRPEHHWLNRIYSKTVRIPTYTKQKKFLDKTCSFRYQATEHIMPFGVVAVTPSLMVIATTASIHENQTSHKYRKTHIDDTFCAD